MRTTANRLFVKVFVGLVEYLLILLACQGAYYLRYPGLPAFEAYYLSFSVVFQLTWVGASLFSRSYDSAAISQLKALVRALALAFLLHLLVISIYLLGTKTQDISRLFLLYSYALFLFGVVAFRSVLILFHHYWQSLRVGHRHLILLGQGRSLDRIAALARAGRATVHWLGQTGMSPAGQAELVEQVQTLCLRKPVEALYVALPLAEELGELAPFARAHGMAFRLVADSPIWEQRRVSVDFVDTIPVLEMEENPLNQPLHRALKRVFDVGVALFGILLIYPWWLPAATLVLWLRGRRPVWARYPYVGRGGVRFHVWTFGAEQAPMDRQASPWRHSRLYLLPALGQVLRGRLSVVGPLPAPEGPGYPCRPGLTGLSLSSGQWYPGQPGDERQLVGHYLARWSLLLDLKILLHALWEQLAGPVQAPSAKPERHRNQTPQMPNLG
ncbi:MAG: hypothetical protein D6722_07275 [Bacteroidetes bacterium]|nr:MAG: hypothetical protein D6722_07275 [Bacteroidota bacterium]